MSEPNYRNIGGNGLSAFVVLGLFFLLALVSKAMVVVVLIITFIVFYARKRSLSSCSSNRDEGD